MVMKITVVVVMSANKRGAIFYGGRRRWKYQELRKAHSKEGVKSGLNILLCQSNFFSFNFVDLANLEKKKNSKSFCWHMKEMKSSRKLLQLTMSICNSIIGKELALGRAPPQSATRSHFCVCKKWCLGVTCMFFFLNKIIKQFGL